MQPRLSTRQDLLDQWHPTKNEREPGEFTTGSSYKAWWKCAEGPDHEWRATITDRVKGRGCPFCAGRKASVTNSLERLYPEVAAEWHARNPATPAETVATSDDFAWWRCTNGPDHVWRSRVSTRTRQGAGCPYCGGQRVSRTNSLVTLYPELASEWHPTRNDTSPSEVLAQSKLRAWWKCPEGPDHEWDQQVRVRVRGNGCPYCAGYRPSVTNNLLRFPEVAHQWDSERNDTAPEHVVASSHEKYWWICPEGPDHRWQATPYHRTERGQGCPFCAGHRVSITNALASTDPTIASEWDEELNEASPRDVARGSKLRAWWTCSTNSEHRWLARVADRARGKGCPYCAGVKTGRKRVAPGESLAERFPKLMQEWHPTKNLLDPAVLLPGSGEEVWWKCANGPDHEWEATPHHRATRGQGCPFCAGHRPSVTNSLALYPELTAQWSMRNEIVPDDVVATTTDLYWWTCPEGPDHEWRASPASRVRGGHGCPFCAGLRASVTNSVASVRPDLAQQWHATRNGALSPGTVTIGSQLPVWWQCPEHASHEWCVSPCDRIHYETGCPYCSNRRVSETNSLQALYPALARQWHPTLNEAGPDQVGAGSKEKAWWKCAEGPDHEWEAVVRNRALGQGCPFCASQRPSVTNSVARHARLLAEWHPTLNDRAAADVVAGSKEKYWWQCSNDPRHQWQATPQDRTYARSGCPYCNLKAESRIEILLRYELATLLREDPLALKVATRERVWSCDVVLTGCKTVVEYDSHYWHKAKFSQDLLKTESLERAGWFVLRLREEPLDVVRPTDLQVDSSASAKQTAQRVLDQLVETGLIEPSIAIRYRALEAAQAVEAAEAYIARSLRPRNKVEPT